MGLFENVIWEFWTLGVMALLKNGFFVKVFMGVMNLGSYGSWEYWTHLFFLVLGVMDLGSFGPWEHWAFLKM